MNPKNLFSYLNDLSFNLNNNTKVVNSPPIEVINLKKLLFFSRKIKLKNVRDHIVN